MLKGETLYFCPVHSLQHLLLFCHQIYLLADRSTLKKAVVSLSVILLFLSKMNPRYILKQLYSTEENVLFIPCLEFPRTSSGLIFWHLWQQAKTFSLILFSSFSLFLCKFVCSSELWLEVGFGCIVPSRGMHILQFTYTWSSTEKAGIAHKPAFDLYHKVIVCNLCWK